MKILCKQKISFIVMMAIILFSCLVEANTFVAYSMKEAERRLKDANYSSEELMKIAGITRIAGMVYDADKRDVIIVGQIGQKGQKITIDDLVVAVRALFEHQAWPAVSIDKTSDTKKTGKQIVRFEGGIANTKFGKDLLEADIILKKMGLGLLSTNIWGVPSYFAMSVEYAKEKGMDENISARFWFYPMNNSFSTREGVFAIQELRVGVRTQVMNIGGKVVGDNAEVRDKVGDEFTKALTDNYADISTYYPEIERLKVLFDLVAVAKGIQSLPSKPEMNYWLNEYKVNLVETPKDYPLLSSPRGKIQNVDKVKILEIEGGIELKALLLRLQDGDVTALKEAVLKSRPKTDSLTWKVPLEGWRIPGTPEEQIDENTNAVNSSEDTSVRGKFGMSLDRKIYPIDAPNNVKNPVIDFKPAPLSRGLPDIKITDRLTSQRYSSNVGGVMLRDVAKVEGAEEARVDLMSGNFSLVVDGQNARLDPAVLRKFVTALWSVYYSSEDPGISIDPIAPGEKKHLVRYIGKVLNNDLGRVMREADYVMKKWSVGTERADVPGFMNPDDAANQRGVVNAGAWSRFWFVPENMKFKRGGDMLLFDDGRMTLKTEYMFMDDKDMHSDPSNEDFSRFFTEHYNKIAEKYPVYKDLFDYAKLVSLAKYLKENGVPLYWFLMANKDLVITEDSPGTVESFAKDSDYFRGVSIEGGVNLGFDVKQEGHYVYDQTAIDAINRAVSKLHTNTTSTSISANPSITKTGSDPFSFDLGKESYTVLPQHSLTSGKDRRGIRYQTDIALRGAGFRLTEEALGNIEYYVYRRELAKEINPIVESMDKQKLEAEYENIYKEKDKIATGRAEKVIEKLKGLKDQDFKAEDKFVIALEKTLGKEQLDQFKPLILKHTYYKTNLEIVRYFNPNKEDVSEFGKGWKLLIPYQIKPHGDTKIEFLNVRIPEKMAVENLITGEQEVLTFSKDQYTSAGYVPEKIEKSQVVGLFLMTDVSYRLADKLGNQFWFNPSGYLTDMIFSEQQRVHVDYLGEFTDAFDQPPYHVQPAGKERIKFLNVRVPKKIEVVDLVRGGSEELVFNDKGEYAGYVPEDERKSRYKILALMSNGSYQLVDKEKNEVKFSPTGDFEGMIVHSSYPIVKSVSQGGHKVGFTYTTDKSGKVFVAHAYLSEDKQDAKPLYMVGYKYDDEGRLYRTKGESKLAEASRTSGNEVR